MSRPDSTPVPDDQDTGPWYAGITRYQWLVLLIASLGWVFDIFEGQIFVASMQDAMPSLVGRGEVADELGLSDPEQIEQAYRGRMALYNNIALGAFLLGGAFGGILFGTLSDRIGRKRTMSLTIAFYSVFTCVSAFSQEWWHLAGLRFLVAMGVGGEWAVASAMVAEVFPKRARANVGGIFHASSVFGTYLAVLAGFFLIGNVQLQRYAEEVGMPSLPWRLGFAIGVLPALLIIWIRMSLREPESWEQARLRAAEQTDQQMGTIGDLFRGSLLGHTLVGVTLAAVGLATFWGAHIHGRLLMKDAVAAQYESRSFSESGWDAVADATRATLRQREPAPAPSEVDAALERLRQRVSSDGPKGIEPDALAGASELDRAAAASVSAEIAARVKRWEMIGMFLVTTGGGLGLVLFGPFSQRLGRRGAFLLYHAGGLAIALAAFQMEQLHTVPILFVLLPVFGFLTLGMHAGYAIYFPELYPTRLRGTGTGFCFNAGRIIAAPILLFSGMIQSWVTLEDAASLISLLFIVGIVVLLFAPETRGRELPE
jgi:MFS family permease